MMDRKAAIRQAAEYRVEKWADLYARASVAAAQGLPMAEAIAAAALEELSAAREALRQAGA